jgi:hypothetical protein
MSFLKTGKSFTLGMARFGVFLKALTAHHHTSSETMRGDWLEAVGMSKPETIDTFY